MPPTPCPFCCSVPFLGLVAATLVLLCSQALLPCSLPHLVVPACVLPPAHAFFCHPWVHLPVYVCDLFCRRRKGHIPHAYYHFSSYPAWWPSCAFCSFFPYSAVNRHALLPLLFPCLPLTPLFFCLTGRLPISPYLPVLVIPFLEVEDWPCTCLYLLCPIYILLPGRRREWDWGLFAMPAFLLPLFHCLPLPCYV